MKILVLGGCGTQGRTAILDLASDDTVKEIICGDISFDALSKIQPFVDMDKITTARIDADNKNDLLNLFKKADIVIDLLPKDFQDSISQAALESGVSVVHTNYAYSADDLNQKAKQANIAIMPECGLDPGIDLVIYGRAKKRFDEMNVILSYCGGFPEKKACNNPLNYKLSWIWRGVLSSTMRDSRIIRDNEIIEIPAALQHEKEYVHSIDFPGLGELEAIPNGNAVFFTDILGVTDTITHTGRYALRWPGWSDFWRPLKEFGFLGTKPVQGLPADISGMDFLDKLMASQLEYKDDEKDIVAMANIFEGVKNRKRIRFTSTLLIERDLETGLMAMSKGVGYTAGIVAKMLARGDIKEKGVLSPSKHIPDELFLKSLKKRGIQIVEQTQVLDG
jgi:lysine 6-dehydrogenase